MELLATPFAPRPNELDPVEGVAAGLNTGNSELVHNGAQISGLIPTIAAAFIGSFDTVRKKQG